MINIIAAIGQRRELCKNNALLWAIPDDLKRFKQLTMGHPIIMGRKTFESIGRPLPGRTNLVVSRSGLSLEEALTQAQRAPGGKEIFVIGGAQIYEQALPLADKLYLTIIDASDKDADIFFPAYENILTKKVFEEAHECNGLKYRWINLEK
jgi:dihydrofolate reductase